MFEMSEGMVWGKDGLPVETEEYQARLGELREEIDQIDGELLPLFLRRMGCSKRVAQLKGKRVCLCSVPNGSRRSWIRCGPGWGRRGCCRSPVQFHHGHQPRQAAQPSPKRRFSPKAGSHRCPDFENRRGESHVSRRSGRLFSQSGIGVLWKDLSGI